MVTYIFMKCIDLVLYTYESFIIFINPFNKLNGLCQDTNVTTSFTFKDLILSMNFYDFYVYMYISKN